MPYSLLSPAAALKMICLNLRSEMLQRYAAEAGDVFVPAARLLRLGIIETELEALASSTLNRYRHARVASRRLLTAMAVLLPLASQARWRDDWLSELRTLPTRRGRPRFATHTLFGVARRAVTLRRSILRSPQARP